MKIWRLVNSGKDPLIKALTKRQKRGLSSGFWHEALAGVRFWGAGIAMVVGVMVLGFVGDAVLFEFETARLLSPVARMLLVFAIFGISYLPVALMHYVFLKTHRRYARARLRTCGGRPFLCHQCAYDLRRSRTATCPECGWVIEVMPKRPRERWRVVRGRRIARFIFALSLVGFAGMVVWVGWLVVEALRTW